MADPTYIEVAYVGYPQVCLVLDASKRAIIDYSSACALPAVWEVMRSYSYADPACADGQIDISRFRIYVSRYLEHVPLTSHDLETTPFLYYFQVARSRYGYREYLEHPSESRESLLAFGFWRTNLCRWLEEHATQLSRELSAMALLQPSGTSGAD